MFKTALFLQFTSAAAISASAAVHGTSPHSEDPLERSLLHSDDPSVLHQHGEGKEEKIVTFLVNRHGQSENNLNTNCFDSCVHDKDEPHLTEKGTKQ